MLRDRMVSSGVGVLTEHVLVAFGKVVAACQVIEVILHIGAEVGDRVVVRREEAVDLHLAIIAEVEVPLSSPDGHPLDGLARG